MFLMKSRKMLTVLLVLLMTLSCLWSASAREEETTEPVAPNGVGTITEPLDEPTDGNQPTEPEPETTPDPTDEPTTAPPPVQPTEEPAQEPPVYGGVIVRKTPAPEVKYQVTYKTGKADITMTVTEGEILRRPRAVPSADGYVFKHWYLKDTDSQVPFTFGNPVTADMTLIAYFVAVEVPTEPASEEGGEEPTDETEQPADSGDAAGTEPTGLDNGGLDIVIVDDPDGEEADGDGSEQIIDDEIPLAGPTATEPALRKVTIRKNFGMSVVEGDMIILTGVLTGFEGLNVSYQWQVNDGTGWRDIAGATNSSYVFAANAQTVEYSFRLGVSVNE